MEASITLKKISQTTNDKIVLAGLSFGIEKNSTVAVIGDSNDSGITEFLYLLGGYRKPQNGELFIHGMDSIKNRATIRKLIGFVPFVNDMDPGLTAEQNITFINKFYKIDREILDSNYNNYADFLGLQSVSQTKVNELSPGILRKLTLLRELIREPKILVLEHPTAFMSSDDAELTWNLLQELRDKITIIYHDYSLRAVENFHDRILFFTNGSIELDDNFQNMINNWMGRYQFIIQFEKLLMPLFRKIAGVEGIIAPQKDGNILKFNTNDKRILLKLSKYLESENILKIESKNIHLEDLLAARFLQEGIV